MLYEKEKTYSALCLIIFNPCKSKILLLMILNEKGRRYLGVTKLSAVLRVITSNRRLDFHFVNFYFVFNFLQQIIPFNLMKRFAVIKILVELFCRPKKNIPLEFNQYMKSDQMSYNIYTDIGLLFSKRDNCKKKSGKIFNSKSKKTYSLQTFNVI